jgi:hypothetical protein
MKNLSWVLCGRCNFSTCFGLTYIMKEHVALHTIQIVWHGVFVTLTNVPSPLLYHRNFIVGLAKGVPSNMIFEPGDLEFESRPHIFRCS